jgi:hypothetical protein
MKALSGMAVCSSDPETGMNWLIAEDEHRHKFEEAALKEMIDATDSEVTPDQVAAIEQFCEIVRTRRTLWAGKIARRKARLAGITK